MYIGGTLAQVAQLMERRYEFPLPPRDPFYFQVDLGYSYKGPWAWGREKKKNGEETRAIHGKENDTKKTWRSDEPQVYVRVLQPLVQNHY